MDKIPVKLSKFNNQSKQYDHFFSFELTHTQLQSGLDAFNRGKRQQVEEHYLYQYQVNGIDTTLYSVSPALFDPETVSV